MALTFRVRFPTPHDITTASLSALRETRVKYFPSEAKLQLLQQLARESIGIANVDRLRGMKIEQELLIKELRLVQEHLARLDAEIADIVKTCREGQILLSMPPIGPVQAATIIATIGGISTISRKRLNSNPTLAGHREGNRQVSRLIEQGLLTEGCEKSKQMLYLMGCAGQQRLTVNGHGSTAVCSLVWRPTATA